MQKLLKFLKSLLVFLFAFLFFTSCEKTLDVGSSSASLSGSSTGGSNANMPGDSTQNQPGVLTAGEWSDLKNWGFFTNIMLNDTFATHKTTWGFYPQFMWPIKVKNASGLPAIDVTIKFYNSGNLIWSGKTDNTGILYAVPGIYMQSPTNAINYVVYNGSNTLQSGVLPTISQPVEITLSQSISTVPVVDLMFVVDATGSMGDELNYLKVELLDVLNRAQQNLTGTTLRYSAVYYRDEGDDYVTKSQNFTTNKSTIVNFVGSQSAAGGGDWPEAVHTALDKALQQSWSSSAKARLLFLILDAPPHKDAAILQAVRNQVKQASEQGIKIIPLSASGTDKELEFLLRFMAIGTNGTYTFLTNHSGIGNNHITPTIGNYTVEFLNNQMVRLITEYGR